MIPTASLLKDIYRTTWLEPDPPAVVARRDKRRARVKALATLLRRLIPAPTGAPEFTRTPAQIQPTR